MYRAALLLLVSLLISAHRDKPDAREIIRGAIRAHGDGRAGKPAVTLELLRVKEEEEPEEFALLIQIQGLDKFRW